MNTDRIGISLIERNEGCVLHAYPDPISGGDPWTIGFGCTGPGIHKGLVITQAQANQMLADRLTKEFDPGVSRLIGNAPTTQDQFDSMVSLSYNIGLGAFGHSSVLHDHVTGNHAAAAAAFLWWDHAGGRAIQALKRRRLEESKLYLSDQPLQPPIPTPQPTILDLQKRLNQWCINPPLEEDGAYGPETRDAIFVFQAENKLPLTGIPDTATIAALLTGS